MRLILFLSLFMMDFAYSKVSNMVLFSISNARNDLLSDASNGGVNYYFNYDHKNGHRFQARSGINLNFDTSEASLTDARLRHRYTFYSKKANKDGWIVGSDSRVYLAFSQNSQDTKEFIPLIQLAPHFTYSFTIENDLTIGLAYKPMYSRTFNTVDRVPADPQDPNNGLVINTIDQSIDHGFIFTLSYLKIYFEAYFDFKMQWDSQSRRVDDQFNTYQELYYAINNQFSIGLGHQSGAFIYDKRGSNQTFKFAEGDSFYLMGIINF